MNAGLADESERARATDVDRSVIVQAPAGSGKTSLLVARYLKLLAVVADPEEILAITFTRKAAAEMRARVQEALEASRPEALPALARSDALGWRLREQPGRLRIQTIDALALSLVRRLPIGAGFDPGARLVESARDLYEQAAERVLLRLYGNDPLADSVADFLLRCDNDQRKARRLLADMLGRRDQWLEVVSAVVAAYRDEPWRVGAVLEAGIGELQRSCIDAFESACTDAELATLETLAVHAGHVLGIDASEPVTRYRLIAEMFTTRERGWRRQVDRRQGLRPGDSTLKARVRELVEAFEARGLRARLADLRDLPDATLDAQTLRALVDVCVNLALANLELGALFDAGRVIDFNALTLGARTALGESLDPTELALALDGRISHLLVDEFQDTSVAQFRLFEQLIGGWSPGDGRSFFAVGDPMQSIYRFRDADVGLFLDAWEHGIGDLALERVSLTSNFRSDPGLVEWFNRAFSKILGSESDPVMGRIPHARSIATRAAPVDPAAVGVTIAEDAARETAAIVARIENLLASASGSIAVLVRSRTHLETLLPALRARSIDWHAADIEPLIDKPAVTDLLTLQRALANPHDRLAWFSLLRTPWVGLSLVDLEAFTDTPNIADGLAELPAGLSADGRARVMRLEGALRAVRAARDERPPRSILEAVWLRMDAADAYPDPLAAHHAERLLELIDGLGSRGFDAALTAASAEALFASDRTRGRLEIMTIHRAKGLEFDHVLIPYLEKTTARSEREVLLWRALTDGLLIGVADDRAAYDWLARESRARERHEIERLFYVACTRARRSLSLFASEPTGRPVAGSLLELLLRADARPAAEPVALQVRDGRPMVAAAAGRVGTRPRASVRHLRLSVAPPRRHPPRRYPSRQDETAASGAADSPRGPTTAAMDPARAAVDILVRHALAELARLPLPESIRAHIERRQTPWRNLLVDRGIGAHLHDAALGEAGRQLAAVAGDPAGRRFLAARDGAYSELLLTGSDRSRLCDVTIDRTFVDSGTRWMVEYHTDVPAPGEDRDSFVHRLSRTLAEQVALKARIASARFTVPVRVGVYFTALPRLEEQHTAY